MRRGHGRPLVARLPGPQESELGRESFVACCRPLCFVVVVLLPGQHRLRSSRNSYRRYLDSSPPFVLTLHLFLYEVLFVVHCAGIGVPRFTLVSSSDNLWRFVSLWFCAHCAPFFAFGCWILAGYEICPSGAQSASNGRLLSDPSVRIAWQFLGSPSFIWWFDHIDVEIPCNMGSPYQNFTRASICSWRNKLEWEVSHQNSMIYALFVVNVSPTHITRERSFSPSKCAFFFCTQYILRGWDWSCLNTCYLFRKCE